MLAECYTLLFHLMTEAQPLAERHTKSANLLTAAEYDKPTTFNTRQFTSTDTGT